jgi:hypothetical protein
MIKAIEKQFQFNRDEINQIQKILKK